METQFSKVYVYCPRGLETGGPEALHQLVASLCSQGIDAFIVPTPGTEGNRPVDRYREYSCPEAEIAEDVSGAAVVAPEPWIDLLLAFRRATPVCWWLSVDNAKYAPRRSHRDRDVVATPRGRAMWLARNVSSPYRSLRRRLFPYDRMLHLAQSAYAWCYLKWTLGVEAGSLSDFTVVPALDAHLEAADRRFLAYNPAKGGPAVERLKASGWDFGGLEPLALREMSHSEVVASLKQSLVYLDLGHHPGKDRMPREAVSMGCVVLVARRGAASYLADVPLAPEYKLDVTDLDASVRRAVAAVTADSGLARERQSSYRLTVSLERSIFDSQVRSFFIEGRFTDESVAATFALSLDDYDRWVAPRPRAGEPLGSGFADITATTK